MVPAGCSPAARNARIAERLAAVVAYWYAGRELLETRLPKEGQVLIVVMGVCGSGKTAVGTALAEQLHVPFLEGDSFHSKANVAKMRSGLPLTDEDREPWLQTLADTLQAHTESGAVLACSALRKRYRDLLRAGGLLTLVHLSGTRQTIVDRMSGRSGHYMPTSLLDSQLAILEPPGEDECHLEVDIDRPVEQIVRAVRCWMEAQSFRLY